MIQRLRKEHPGLLVFEAGDLLFPRRRQPGTRARLLSRAQFILKSLGPLGVDAWCPSVLDLGMGLSELRKQAEAAGIPLVSANLEDAQGKTVLPAYRLLSRAGLRLAVVGLTGPWPRSLPEGLRLADPAQALARVSAELADRVDLFIVLSSQGIEDDTRLAAEVEGAYLFLGAGDDRMILMPRRMGDSLLLQPYKQGEYLGILRLQPATPLLPILDGLEQAQLQRRLDKLPPEKPEADRLRHRLKGFENHSLLRASLRPLSEEDPAMRQAIVEQVRREAAMP